jgi:plasmid stabilization system protein ParE
MSYVVIITRQAARELDLAANWIAKQAPVAAARWYNGFVAAILRLNNNPRRCALAHEHRDFPYELRELLYGRRRNYRALFTIRKNEVVILGIRHAAQRDVTPDDFI